MSSPRSCPKCSGIMEESETSLTLEERAKETKIALSAGIFLPVMWVHRVLEGLTGQSRCIRGVIDKGWQLVYLSASRL